MLKKPTERYRHYSQGTEPSFRAQPAPLMTGQKGKLAKQVQLRMTATTCRSWDDFEEFSHNLPPEWHLETWAPSRRSTRPKRTNLQRMWGCSILPMLTLSKLSCNPGAEIYEESHPIGKDLFQTEKQGPSLEITSDNEYMPSTSKTYWVCPKKDLQLFGLKSLLHWGRLYSCWIRSSICCATQTALRRSKHQRWPI